MKIHVFKGTMPCLDINQDNMGLYRERDPDAHWDDLRRAIITESKQEEFTPALKQILLEDLAYTYGRESDKFIAKVKEFKLL